MLGHLAMKLLGGIWRVRERALESRWGFVRRINRLALSLYLYENGAYIGPGASFASAPVLPHGPKGVFVSGGSRIGRNCVIFQQVTIGSNTLPDSRRCGAPTIGDDCYIGAGAKIVGNVRVGNGCRIGANCVIFEDVPDGSVVVMPRPRVIAKGEMDNRLYGLSEHGWVCFEDEHYKPVTDPQILARLNGSAEAA